MIWIILSITTFAYQKTNLSINYIDEVRIYFTVFESTPVGNIADCYYLYFEDCYCTGIFQKSVVAPTNCYMSSFKRNCFFRAELEGESMGLIHLGLAFSKVSYNSFSNTIKTTHNLRNYGFISALTHEVWNCNYSYNQEPSLCVSNGVVSYSLFFNSSNAESDIFFAGPEFLKCVSIIDSFNSAVFGESINTSTKFNAQNSNIINCKSLASSSTMLIGIFTHCFFDKDYSNGQFIFSDNANEMMKKDFAFLNTYKCRAVITMTVEFSHSFCVSYPTLHPQSISHFVVPSRNSNDVPHENYTKDTHELFTIKAQDVDFNIYLLSCMAALIVVVISSVVVVVGCRKNTRNEDKDDADDDINTMYKCSGYDFPMDNGNIFEDDFF